MTTKSEVMSIARSIQAGAEERIGELILAIENMHTDDHRRIHIVSDRDNGVSAAFTKPDLACEYVKARIKWANKVVVSTLQIDSLDGPVTRQNGITFVSLNEPDQEEPQ